jgi:glycosyltransferase involved in cell wall biosynthesis
MPKQPKIALWFRYGPAEHTELFHAMPEIVKALSRHAEVHYFGLKSRKPIPAAILQNATVHSLPFYVNRSSNRDKLLKTAIWVLCLPWIGLVCRLRGFDAVYIDETVPLTAGIARAFFGPNVAFSIVDFFPEIYFGHSRLLRPAVRLLRAIELAAWRRLPVVFTRAVSTQTWLVQRGLQANRIHPVYDPCDFTIYRPVDRSAARRRFGYAPDDIVLVHHGILHPNKGNDRVLRALAQARRTLPAIRYLLVGDGPEMPRLKALASELGIADIVQLTGWLPKMTDVNEALNAGDIGLVMRIGDQSDDFHMTGALVHNMAAGLPILAARLGGVSEVVRDGDAGLLFDPNDADQFTTALMRLSRDPALRAQMGQRAYVLARELFDMTKVTQATVQPLLSLAREAST